MDKGIAWVHRQQVKGKKKAIPIPLNEVGLWVLRQQAGKHPNAVFTYRGRSIKQVNGKAWHKALADVGIEDFRWHDLRHTWASWLAMNGASLLEIKELGGWETSAMVEWHAHLASHHLKRISTKIDNDLRRSFSNEGTFLAHSLGESWA